MRRKSPHELRNKNNYVAKHACKFNKSMVYSNKYKETKNGYEKHKKNKYNKDNI